MVNTISATDVSHVAKSINKILTEEQINEVLELYPSEQRADPTGEWYLVVEHCIHSIIE